MYTTRDLVIACVTVFFTALVCTVIYSDAQVRVAETCREAGC